MTNPRNVSPEDAARILAERDPVIRRLVKEAGLPVFPKPQGTHFASLVQSITYQQLAGGAARADPSTACAGAWWRGHTRADPRDVAR